MNTANKIWFGILIGFVSLVLFVATYFIVMPKHIVRYDLGNSYSDGIPRIKADIENGTDYTITLSKEVSWEQAVRMVDSLNSTLHKYPISK